MPRTLCIWSECGLLPPHHSGNGVMGRFTISVCKLIHDHKKLGPTELCAGCSWFLLWPSTVVEVSLTLGRITVGLPQPPPSASPFVNLRSAL